MGSGNIGATNITRVFGWYAGALVFLIDFLKGCVPLLVVKHYLPEDTRALSVVGTCLVLGHCFSLFLKFRGGKGVATSVGCIAVVAPWAAGGATLVYLTLLLITRISAVGSLGGIATMLGYLIFCRPPAYVTWLVICLSFVVVIRHHSNIRRLVEGIKAKRAS